MPTLRKLTKFERDILALVGARGVLRRMEEKLEIVDGKAAEAAHQARLALEKLMDLALASYQARFPAAEQSTVVSLFRRHSNERR